MWQMVIVVRSIAICYMIDDIRRVAMSWETEMSNDTAFLGVSFAILLLLLLVAFLCKKLKKYKLEQALFQQTQMGYPNPPPLRSPIPSEPYPIFHLPNCLNAGGMRDAVVTIDGSLQRQFCEYLESHMNVPNQVFSPRHYEPPPPYPDEPSKT